MDRARELDHLIDGAEELLTQLTDAHDPRIQELRDRVDKAVADAWRAIGSEAPEASLPWREFAGNVDGYIHDYPWLALLTGTLVAGTLGYLAGVTARPGKGRRR